MAEGAEWTDLPDVSCHCRVLATSAPHDTGARMNRSTPQASRGRGDCPLREIPEFQLLVPGFILSLVWEVLQSPLYADTYTAPWVTVAFNRLHCAGGDTLILLAAFWLVALYWGRSWGHLVHWASGVTFVVLGVAYTAGSEYVNVLALRRWVYSRWMPTVAGIGLVPLLQWIVVPSLSVQLARGGGCPRGAGSHRDMRKGERS